MSIASLGEMAIKLNIGKLPLQGAFEDIEPQLIAAGIKILPVTFTDTIYKKSCYTTIFWLVCSTIV